MATGRLLGTGGVPAALCVCALLGCGGDSKPEMELLTLHEIVVKPGEAARYEAGFKAWLEPMRKHPQELGTWRFQTFIRDDGTYSMEHVIGSFADLDREFRDRGQFMASHFLEWKTSDPTWNESVDHYSGDWVLGRRPDLSYRPGASGCGGMPLLRRRRVHFSQDRDDAISDALRDYAQLARSEHSPLAVVVYDFLYGPDFPCYLVETCAKDEESLNKLEAEHGLTPQTSALWTRLRAGARRIESADYHRRPDLSFDVTAR